MLKDKKRDESKKEKKISVEAEVALLGLLLAIVSLIGLLNQGWLGGLLTYCLVYLFGNMYYLFVIFNIYFGFYLFFKRKKPNIVLGINGVGKSTLLNIITGNLEYEEGSIALKSDLRIGYLRQNESLNTSNTLKEEFENLGATVYVTTVDGSVGTKGFVDRKSVV